MNPTYAILDAVPAPVYVWERDPRGIVRLAAFNAAALAITDGLIPNFLGRALEEVYENDVVAQHTRQVLADGVTRCLEHYYTLRTTGRAHWLASTFTRWNADTVVITAVDTTSAHAAAAALREREAQLRQAQKMEAVGQLAGGIAHDFNNLLTAIGGHAELLAEAIVRNDPRRADVEEIQRAAGRAAALTRQLLAFSRRQILAPQTLSLHEVVDGVLPMVRRLIGEDVRVGRHRDESGATVLADRAQLEQVIINLALNARDAMPRGGVLSILTGSEGDHAVLSVRDTGVGMSEATRERIFEPFFTTKPAGAGTGLGLATVYGIVEQSGGTIHVESVPERGSCFRVTLPLTSEEPPPAATPPTDQEPGGSETILVVEDEPAVRSIARRALQRFGYRVIEAATGESALRIFHEVMPAVDLVLTDVVMPGMGGRELAERVQALSPATPVLYMSGYTDDEIVRRGARVADGSFVQKPFTPRGLALAVRRLLHDRVTTGPNGA